ncbi:MAG: 50S ribosome-binding GTPase, partial [Eubacteriales bacterium]|nr:50S ribosome-binding GTPase [Eubacteriales bacterium]
MSQQPFRSGFVSLIGLPNAGKSTLLNQLSGLHLAITSPKPQTTRHIIQAIIDQPDSQIIFLDTPGYHQPKSRLDRYMAGRI